MAEAVETGAPAPNDTAAAAVPDDRSPLERLSPSERETWNLKGELPTHITGEKPAAKPADDDAPAVDARGQQITDNGKPISKREQRQRDTIARAVNEATALERQRAERAERELADLRRGQPQSAAQPQPVAKPVEDAEPTLDDFLDQPDPYLAYTRAISKWDIAQARKAEAAERQTQTQQQQAHAQVMDRVVAHTQRQDALKATVPDYDQRTQAVRENLDLRSPLALAVVESDVSEHLILHLADHPEDFQRIGALGMSNMTAALREIGRLEAQFSSGHSSAPGAVPPQPKLVSSAPPPPPVLGTRSADPTDASRAAVSRGDYSAFAASEDAKDIARMARR